LNNMIDIIADQRIQAIWNSWLEERQRSGQYVLARVIEQKHHTYICLAGDGRNIPAQIAGSFESEQRSREEYPVVGDWVALKLPDLPSDSGDGPRALISDVFPRHSSMSRAAAGDRTEKQVIVANIDYVLLVFGLDGGRNFLEAMLERSLTTAWNSGAKPVIVLNKADAASDEYREEARAAAGEIAFGVPVHLVSAHTGEGIVELAAELAGGKNGGAAEDAKAPPVVAMLGKSGVGKSALVNALYRIAPAEGRADGAHEAESPGESVALEGAQRKGDNQGRHTTTNSRLYHLPFGAWIADVPGLRELKIWGDEDDLAQVFPEIAELSEQCRFRDCRHEAEPGCAVREALEGGELDERRYASWQKLQRELDYLERRTDEQAARAERAKWKAINKSMRNFRKPGR
jgi:ribosome biogenesis GTPase